MVTRAELTDFHVKRKICPISYPYTIHITPVIEKKILRKQKYKMKIEKGSVNNVISLSRSRLKKN